MYLLTISGGYPGHPQPFFGLLAARVQSEIAAAAKDALSITCKSLLPYLMEKLADLPNSVPPIYVAANVDGSLVDCHQSPWKQHFIDYMDELPKACVKPASPALH